MIKRPILERIEGWHYYAMQMGIPLTRILVHPDDFVAAPLSFAGLPVESMKGRPQWGTRQGQTRVDLNKYEGTFK